MLTVEEVAAILKVQPLTVRQMFREGRIRGFKIGKAWRTTMPVLEEDITCMSRGVTPPRLEQTAPETAADTGVNEAVPARKPRVRKRPVMVEAVAPESVQEPPRSVAEGEPVAAVPDVPEPVQESPAVAPAEENTSVTVDTPEPAPEPLAAAGLADENVSAAADAPEPPTVADPLEEKTSAAADAPAPEEPEVGSKRRRKSAPEEYTEQQLLF